MGTVISPSAQVMSDPESDDEDELVDGISWAEHRRYYDALPWYALPVSNLFSDANLGAWSGISLVLFAMKFFAVAAATTATVAALVLCVSVLTALLWFAVFVLVGSKDHRLLYREMRFGKVLQTFWVGAIACTLGVYAVRAVIGAVMTLVPFFSTPEEVLHGGGGDYEDAYADADDAAGNPSSPEAAGNDVLVAFVVAYLAAGLSEELAKYFGIAMYYPPWDLLEREGGGDGSFRVSQPDKNVGDHTTEKGSTVPEINARSRRRVGCLSPAAGWVVPVQNPRVAVYLAFVVGLGFSFTENIQYGANVYEAATAWGEQGNVTMQRNVTLNPFPGALTFATEHGAILDKRDAAAKTWSTILAVDASVADVRATERDRPYARAATALENAVAEEKRIAGVTEVGRAGAAPDAEAEAETERVGEKPDQNDVLGSVLGSAAREVLEVVSAAFLNWSGVDERVVQADVDAALADALEETRREAAGSVVGESEDAAETSPRFSGARETSDDASDERKDDDTSSSSSFESRIGHSHNTLVSSKPANSGGPDVLSHSSSSSSSPRGKKVLVEERGGIGVVDIFGADVPEDVVREVVDAGHEVADLPEDWPNWEGQNVTVNITVRRRPYTEEAKWGAATTVTLLRGATPMHAVWAGLTSTRYVSRLWVERKSSSDVFGAIAWSWFYHGTFDFAIMAAPALVQSGADASYVFVVLGTGFAVMIWSWSHLVKATFALENNLTRAGFAATRGGRGVPRLGMCTGGDRRLCCCVCMPCVGALCPGMAEWDDAGEADEEGGGYGATR